MSKDDYILSRAIATNFSCQVCDSDISFCDICGDEFFDNSDVYCDKECNNIHICSDCFDEIK